MKKVRRTKRNTITQMTNQELPRYSVDISHYSICDFTPQGKSKASQVHLLLYQRDNPVPISLRFNSKDTLGDLIVELDSARTRVFGKQKGMEEDDENTV